MFPDIEQALTVLLASFVGGEDHTGTAAVADLDGLLPFLRVNRYGGGDDGITETAAVDLSWFAATRSAALDLARAGHAFLIGGPHRIGTGPGSVLVDRVRTVTGPVERPWPNSAIRRFGGSYEVSARRIPGSAP